MLPAAILALTVMPAAGQHLIIEQSPRIIDDPQSDMRSTYAHAAPDHLGQCDPNHWSRGCARVLWDVHEPVPLDEPFRASIPEVVLLHGPGPPIAWQPYVRCGTYHSGVNRRTVTPVQGATCGIERTDDQERLEWSIGGRSEGADYAFPGTYTGMVDLTVENLYDDSQYAIAVPVTYEVLDKMSTCAASWQGMPDLDFGEVPTGISGTVTIPGSGESGVYSGDLESEMLDSGDTYRRTDPRGSLIYVPSVPPVATAVITAEAMIPSSLNAEIYVYYENGAGNWESALLTNAPQRLYLDPSRETTYFTHGEITVDGTEPEGRVAGTVTMTISCM